MVWNSDLTKIANPFNSLDTAAHPYFKQLFDGWTQYQNKGYNRHDESCKFDYLTVFGVIKSI